MDVILIPLLQILYYVAELYIWLLIIGAVLSWLVAFDVINTRNRAVRMIGDAIWRLTEPALRPIRRFLPSFGGLDISPVILILVLIFIQKVILQLMFRIG